MSRLITVAVCLSLSMVLVATSQGQQPTPDKPARTDTQAPKPQPTKAIPQTDIARPASKAKPASKARTVPGEATKTTPRVTTARTDGRSRRDPTVPSRRMMEILKPKTNSGNAAAGPRKRPQLPDIELRARVIPRPPGTPLAILRIDKQHIRVRPNTTVSVASDGTVFTLDIQDITATGIRIHVVTLDTTLVIH